MKKLIISTIAVLSLSLSLKAIDLKDEYRENVGKSTSVFNSWLFQALKTHGCEAIIELAHEVVGWTFQGRQELMNLQTLTSVSTGCESKCRK